jgi:hypothetical protein
MNCRKFTDPYTAETSVSAIDNSPESNVSPNRKMRILTGEDHMEETIYQLYTIFDIRLVPNAIQIFLY